MVGVTSRVLLLKPSAETLSVPGFAGRSEKRNVPCSREYLIRAGCDATLITTRSYGLDHPVDTGKSEAAHAKNRRDDFVVLLPPGAK